MLLVLVVICALLGGPYDQVQSVAAAAAAAPPPAAATRSFSAWAAAAAADDAAAAGVPLPSVVVDTNAPVLRWTSRVDSGGTFAYRVVVTSAAKEQPSSIVWDSGEVWQGNWPSWSPPFPGLAVFEGPGLTPGAEYRFSVTEFQAANHLGHNISSSWPAGAGAFRASSTLVDAKTELIAQLRSHNVSLIWSNVTASIVGRVQPSGHLPTSVSGGYGGIEWEFVRDGSARPALLEGLSRSRPCRLE